MTWYRSCYKKDLLKIRKESQNSLNDLCKPKTTTEIVQVILYELFVKENELFPPEFYKINQFCNKSTSGDYLVLEKLRLLSDFRHNLCGHVFRNSIKHSYLQKYVLQLNTSNKNLDSTLNNNIDDFSTQNSSNIKQKAK